MVPLGENLGIAAAFNAGIEASTAEYVVLLNNDTEQDPGWLEALVRAAEDHPEAGFFASKLVDFHDRTMLDGAGDAMRLSGLPYRLGHGERDGGRFDTPCYVFGACAAAALYRRDMLDEVGLFDEDFVSYCEDGDLSFRAQLAGYRCFYVPDAVVYHMGSASTGGKRSPTATRLGTRNSFSLLVKNLPLSAVPHILPFFALGTARAPDHRRRDGLFAGAPGGTRGRVAPPAAHAREAGRDTEEEEALRRRGPQTPQGVIARRDGEHRAPAAR